MYVIIPSNSCLFAAYSVWTKTSKNHLSLLVYTIHTKHSDWDPTAVWKFSIYIRSVHNTAETETCQYN